jgi:hypothetical protein
VQRTGSGTSQDSDDGRIASGAGEIDLMQVGGVSYLGQARAKASRPLIRGRRGHLRNYQATIRDEALLYADRQRSHSTL